MSRVDPRGLQGIRISPPNDIEKQCGECVTIAVLPSGPCGTPNPFAPPFNIVACLKRVCGRECAIWYAGIRLRETCQLVFRCRGCDLSLAGDCTVVGVRCSWYVEPFPGGGPLVEIGIVKRF